MIRFIADHLLFSMKVFLIDRNDVLVFQDNKRLKVRVENGREFVEPQLNADGTAELQFVRQHELSSRWWWLSAILFWIVGLTGLFTPRYSTFYYSLNCNVKVSEQYDGVALRFAKQYRNNRYNNNVSEVYVVGDGRAQISNGSYVYDQKASRRRKLYKVFSWLARIAVVVILVIVIINRIVNGG